MITEDYVSFEVAKLLKEKGFDECCRAFITSNVDFALESDGRVFNHILLDDEYAAPTFQMVMKWFREVHNLHICIFIGEDSSCDADGSTVDMWHFWSYNVTNLFGNRVYDAYDKLDCVEYQSYEEACEAAIKYCLENLITC